MNYNFFDIEDVKVFQPSDMILKGIVKRHVSGNFFIELAEPLTLRKYIRLFFIIENSLIWLSQLNTEKGNDKLYIPFKVSEELQLMDMQLLKVQIADNKSDAKKKAQLRALTFLY